MNRVALVMFSLLAACYASSASADFSSALCTRAPRSHVDIVTSLYSQACLGHVERDKHGNFRRVVMLPEPMSGDVRASPDLRVIVYIASYLPLMRDEALAQNPVVVRVYRDGSLVKEQRLLDIATADDLQESTSHTMFTKDIANEVTKDELVIITIMGNRVVIKAGT